MKQYRLEATPSVELDIEAAFEWYEREEPGLGFEFIEEIRAAYHRILNHPSAIWNFDRGFGEP